MTTVTRSISFARSGRRKRAVVAASCDGGREAHRPPTVAVDARVGRVPRVSRLMALAIRFDGLLRDGVVADQSELARLARVTQPRMTQIMNLLHLAPDIQEAILFLPEVTEGRDPVTERGLRAICAEVDWGRQREMFDRLIGNI